MTNTYSIQLTTFLHKCNSYDDDDEGKELVYRNGDDLNSQKKVPDVDKCGKGS